MPPDPETRYIKTWEKAEEHAASCMRDWGYSDAKTTALGGDSGIDVISRRAAAQVKFKTAQVGRPELQQLVGARGRDYHKDLLFFAATSYSKHALSYAADLNIALFTYDILGKMTPVNSAANRIVSKTASAPAYDGGPQAAPSRVSERGCCLGCLGTTTIFFWAAVINAVINPDSWKGGVIGVISYVLIALALTWGSVVLARGGQDARSRSDSPESKGP